MALKRHARKISGRLLRLAALAAVFTALPPGAQAAAVRLLGVQLSVETGVYRDSATFERRLDEAVTAGLRASGRRPGDQVIVVLPEHIGTFLAFNGENPYVYTAPSRAAVVARNLLANPGLLRYHLASVARLRTWKAFQTYFALTSLLRYKAASMWKTYTETCSAVARRHKIILVAGSISVPRPEQIGTRLPPVYGTTAVFGPDGALLGVSRKVHPVLEETLFLTPAPLSELGPIATPAGQVGVLICSDSWYADTYTRLKKSDFLAVPSLGEGGLEIFDKQVEKFDGKTFIPKEKPGGAGPTVGESWARHGLVGRISSTGARAAVQPFLTGKLWDMETGGPGVALKRKGKGFSMQVVPSIKGSDTFLHLLSATAGSLP